MVYYPFSLSNIIFWNLLVNCPGLLLIFHSFLNRGHLPSLICIHTSLDIIFVCHRPIFRQVHTKLLEMFHAYADIATFIDVTDAVDVLMDDGYLLEYNLGFD